MTKRIKLFAILLSIILVAGLVGSIGATAAIWSTASGEAGNDSLGTTTKSEDWNVWAKYFEFIEEGTGGAILTKFNADVGFNGNRLVIPIRVGAKSKFVTTISGQVFQIATLKEMVEEIYIPYTVQRICANAFSGFINLKKVVFADSETAETCQVDDFAFSGCVQLNLDSGIVLGKNRTVNFADNAFFPQKYSASGEPTEP